MRAWVFVCVCVLALARVCAGRRAGGDLDAPEGAREEVDGKDHDAQQTRHLITVNRHEGPPAHTNTPSRPPARENSQPDRQTDTHTKRESRSVSTQPHSRRGSPFSSRSPAPLVSCPDITHLFARVCVAVCLCALIRRPRKSSYALSLHSVRSRCHSLPPARERDTARKRPIGDFILSRKKRLSFIEIEETARQAGRQASKQRRERDSRRRKRKRRRRRKITLKSPEPKLITA